MNKAFVRENDQANDRCPRCGSPGQSVRAETLETYLPAELRTELSDSAWFCALPTCEVAYFDMFERSVPASDLLRPVYPKDPDAPICACFGMTTDDIEDDIREGVVTRTKNLLAQAQSEAARCTVLAANGRSCVADVQRYYMKCRERETQGR